MQKVFFLVSCGPDEQSKATRAFQFAKLAAERGALAGILLVDDAVYLAKPEIADRVRAVTGDSLADHAGWLRENAKGLPFLACTPCCHARGVTADDLDPLWVLGTGGTAMDVLIQDGVTSLSF
ncbi:DsrE family protein [Desulfovibrio sp. TomC]|uniref:DsrE family protein n=1 Tax=Desulfovibrio sp. TomC TaxID=1562888 RepID=UPI000575C5B1|nr:DsrE family protein [Desulfovibrio sp. TomC]KHK03703.1 DsrE family protein [Desulfovibrio sp. TomC]